MSQKQCGMDDATRNRLAELLADFRGQENGRAPGTTTLEWCSTLGRSVIFETVDAILEAFDVSEKGAAFSQPEQAENAVRSEAVREAASYIERIQPNGLISKRQVLGDLEAAAYRMERGMTARGNTRVTPVEEGESDE